MSCTGENCDTTNYTLAASYATSSAGKFGLCRGVWDEEQKRFLPATETDTMWCCLNVCKTSADTCLQACMKNYGPDTENGNFKDYSDCRNNCGLIILSCENNCALSGPDIWRGNSPIIDCVKDKGCGSYPNYDTDCIKKNKDDLIRCCRKGCIPSSQIIYPINSMSRRQQCIYKVAPDESCGTRDKIVFHVEPALTCWLYQ